MKNRDIASKLHAGLWPKQFRKSLSDWSQLLTECHGLEPHDKHLEPVGEVILKAFSGPRPSWRTENKGKKLEWKDRGEVTQVFFNALLVQQMDAWLRELGDFEMMLDSLDSEIEMAMLYGLIICARDQFMKVDIKFGPPNLPFSEHRCRLSLSTKDLWRDCLEIEPQARLCGFRVDFMLTFTGERLAPRSQGDDGAKSWHHELQPIQKKMIVECDGHDFHEKTKEQAKRDKLRDRILQSLGFPVYHYTGSEIWDDAFGAAAQVIRHLTGKHPQDYVDTGR